MIDIAIIGGGPAGLSAGLYAKRGGAEATLFEDLYVGGQAVNTLHIENYPGFPDGISGSELGLYMEKQAVNFGLNIQYGNVDRLELKGETKIIYTGAHKTEARAVVFCAGASPKKLSLPREDELTGRGISYCATCDGAFFKNKTVAVMGGGDTALSDALYLARFAQKILLVHRRDAFRASPHLQKPVFAEGKIEIVWDSVVTGLMGEDALTGVRIQNVKTKEESEVALSALFVAIGIEPRTALVKNQLTLTPGGSIETDAFMRTSLPGVFAAGDVRDTPLRQVVTAVADGAIAATTALEYINGMKK